MHISIATLFPSLYEPFLSTSLIQRAVEKELIAFSLENLFSYAAPKKRIDGPTFGHGPGMLIKPDIIEQAVTNLEKAHGKAYKIFFSPHGKKVDQRYLVQLAQKMTEANHTLFLPARYEGMDARVEEYYADEIISIGDYVLMGGDLPTMVTLEGVLRLIPGIVGKQESVVQDSFSGPFVDHPEYTEPVTWKGMEVPEVIRSGNHAAIEAYQRQQAAERSVYHHFDWVRSHIHTKEDISLTAKTMPSHYAILMHDQVVLDQDRVGTSSVTSLDLHDIARSAATYGIKNYFIVTPIENQQAMVKRLLDFWQSDVGIGYNPQRHRAVDLVRIVASLDEAMAVIAEQEGKEPLLLATSAQPPEDKGITYYDQETVWGHKRPVAFLFGTARGLASSVLEEADYQLGPIKGFSDYNHLSVRSAAAIIFDRWFGITIKE